MNNETPLVQASQLCKYYYRRGLWFQKKQIAIKAVDQVSFSLPAGKIIGLIGESGSGKTTLALGLAGLLSFTSGSLTVNQTPIPLRAKQSAPLLSSFVRMVFQNPQASLNPRKTVFDSLGHSLLYHRLVPKQQLAATVAQSLELVGLSSDFFYHYPHQLSGGQQQRVSIARALLGAPKLVICDEVTSSLDLSMQAQILNMLAEVQQKLNLSYLFISHDLPVVRSFCSELLIMNQGQIVEAGATEDIFRSPQHEYTKMLLGSQLPDMPKKRSS